MKHNLRNSVVCLIALSLFLTVSSLTTVVMAQDPAPSPTPTEQELQLQEQKRLLELQRDIELAKKAIRDAQPQAPAVTPLAGDTALENVKLEAEMVAYNAMSEIADRISKEIKAKRSGAKNIAIFDAQVVKDWRFYQALFPAFEGQVNDIKAQYKSLLCDEATINPDVNPLFLASIRCTNPNRDFAAPLSGFQEAFSAGSTLLRSFIDLAALFRTDTKIQGIAFIVEESALVAEVFRALRNDYPEANDLKLYYPEVFPPRIKTNSETVTIVGDLFVYKSEADKVIKKKNADKEVLVASIAEPLARKTEFEEILSQLKHLKKKLQNLEAALPHETNPAVRKKIKAEIANAKVEIARLGESEESLNAKIQAQEAILTPLEAKVKKINTDVKKLASLNERFLAFVTDFVKTDGTGVNALALFIKSEDIKNAMNDPQSYWLEIKSVSAGGNNRVRKNLLTFFTGAKLDHSGGAIIEYTLYENSGAVVYSDKISIYKGYVEPKKIRGPKVFTFEDTVKP